MREGHLLNERYKIIKKIGSGGMAEVFHARDTILERDVAIKALRREYINDSEFIARFDREAQAATSLNHPNIVSIYDVGEEEDNLYMVMEYIDGLTLKEYIQQYGPVDVHDAIDIMKQIISAIAHAHDNDIVHRDIKPQNILMNSFGQAKVTDFGIAIALSATSLTQTNSIVGSVHYLSPEQARGGMATKKSDIYSIGILFYELLTGRLPFSGQSPVSIALKHLQNETPSIRKYNSDIPQSVENIVLKATAKDPFHRYESIYDLEDAVNHALDPDRINEAPFEPPVEVGEETRAIPIITDDQFSNAENQETIISKPTNTTKAYPPDQTEKEKKKPKEKKKKSKKKRGLLIVGFLFAILAAVFVALFVYPGILQPKDVELPDLVGEEFELAKQKLENLKLVVEQELVFSDEVEEGLIVSMNPAAGRVVKEETTVKLTVSEGKERIPMEDYVGQDINQVTRILLDLGFLESNIITFEKHSDRNPGEIINQLQPSPDSGDVVPSETKVIFEISIGPERISLNNLTGMTEAEAREYLEDHELVFSKHEEGSNTVEAGRVIRQAPSSGTELVKGDTVDVYISTGPKEIPSTSHRIIYTVQYTGDEGIEEPGEENQDVVAEPIEQTVRIYIDDANNNISDVYDELTITEDKQVTFTLVIPHNDEAEYIITRDDDVIVNDVISYEEGE